MRQKGLLVVDAVFDVMGILVLVGRVLEGEVSMGDLLELPDGRVLRVISVEKRRRPAYSATAGEVVGLGVVGVNWKPSKEDFEGLLSKNVAERLKEEARRRYSHMPKGAAERFVEAEVRHRLADEIGKHALRVRPSG